MSDDGLEQELRLGGRIAGIRARAAVRARAFPPADSEDLFQELLIACWRAADKFDPVKASLWTFLECVIASRLASAIRTARRGAAMLPLDFITDAGIAPESRLDLHLDVALVLSQLDLPDRRIAVTLMEYSPTEASRKLGIARSTIYQHIGRLRPRFIAAGIRPGYTARTR